MINFIKNNFLKRMFLNKEEEEITKDVSRMEIKKKMKEKMKLKKVNLSKGLDVTDLDKEIDDLKAKLEKLKKVSNEGVDLIMNNTEQYLYHGMLLKNYFYGKKYNSEIPRFSLESAKDKGAKEIIDFKPLNKEETARRYYDNWCCLKQRKKFNNILVNARYWSLLLVGNQYFDNFSLLVIIRMDFIYFRKSNEWNKNFRFGWIACFSYIASFKNCEICERFEKVSYCIIS